MAIPPLEIGDVIQIPTARAHFFDKLGGCASAEYRPNRSGEEFIALLIGTAKCRDSSLDATRMAYEAGLVKLASIDLAMEQAGLSAEKSLEVLGLLRKLHCE